MLTFMLDLLGRIAIAEGHYTEARTALREGLLLRQYLGSRSGIADSLRRIAELAAAEKEFQWALQLAGAAEGIREALGERLSPLGQAKLNQWLLPLERSLGTPAIQSAWKAGRAMPVEQAMELAFAATQPQPEQPDQPVAGSKQRTELSPREQQVAALLAEGLTNRQIAKRLVVTERTVGAHIEHILDKLGFASRHQVAAWAAENGLRV
jgi:DNA-binding CsgD family transcriptional regulator